MVTGRDSCGSVASPPRGRLPAVSRRARYGVFPCLSFPITSGEGRNSPCLLRLFGGLERTDTRHVDPCSYNYYFLRSGFVLCRCSWRTSTSAEIGFCPGDASRGVRVFPGDATWVDGGVWTFSRGSGAVLSPRVFPGMASPACGSSGHGTGAVQVDPLCAGVQALPRAKPLFGWGPAV